MAFTERFSVSILVVLDWTMMPGLTLAAAWIWSGFNPCCIGLDNDAGTCPKPPIQRILCFNPCCIGLDNDA